MSNEDKLGGKEELYMSVITPPETGRKQPVSETYENADKETRAEKEKVSAQSVLPKKPDADRGIDDISDIVDADDGFEKRKKTEISVDMSEVENGLNSGSSVENSVKKSVKDMSYKERLALAASVVDSVCGEISESDFCAVLTDAVLRFSGEKLDYNKIILPCQSEPNLLISKQNNIFLAGVLFYLLSGGKYSVDVWKDSAAEYAVSELAALKAEIKSFTKAANRYVSSAEAETLSSFTKDLLRGIKRKDVAAVVEDDGEVGQVKLFELLWEVLVTKYSNYRPKTWKESIEEYIRKEHNRVCSCTVKGKKFEIYSVSFEGKLDKPLHAACEDYSYSFGFEDGCFLAVCADGVGSSVHSSVGSMATLVLKDILKEKLAPYVVVSKIFGEKKKPVVKDGAFWENLMYFFRFNLAREFYKKWYGYICEYEEANGKTPEPSDYSTTLQFAFGCEKFIACGALGDGVFFVKKREKTGETERVGGRFINDGISGVTQTAVFTAPHLKNNPSALHVEFFNPEEVDSIIITSDGAGAALAGEEKRLCYVLGELSGAPYEDRCKKLEQLARRCADYNETNFGSGDDTSVAHILLRK